MPIRSQRHFFLISSALLGALIGGLIAFYDALINSLLWSSILKRVSQLWLPLFPILALLLSVTALIVFKVKTESMSDEVIREYHEGHTPKTWSELFGKYLASVFTIGLGASAGMEGAAKWVGASSTALLQRKINEHSRLKRYYHKIETALLVGGSAGIAAILRAPISGALMGVETPTRSKIAKEALIPSLVASVSAVLVFKIFRGQQKFLQINEVRFSSIHFKGFCLAALECLILGVAIGLFSRFFLSLLGELKSFRVYFKNRFTLAFVGGVLICFCAYLSYFSIGAPMTLQSGLPVIQHLLSNDLSIYILAILLILKTLAIVLTFSSGGVGGLFVPTATLGAAIGAIVEAALPSTGLPHGSFVLLGIAAISNATYNILFFGIAFVAELSLSPTLTFFSVLCCVPAFYICKGISNSNYQR